MLNIKKCIFCIRRAVKNSVFCRRHRQINRNRAKSREEYLRNKHRCLRCGIIRLRKRVVCQKCIDKWSTWTKKQKASRKKKGLCPRCGRKLRLGKNRSRCLRCQKLRRRLEKECGFFYQRAKYFCSSKWQSTDVKAMQLAKILEEKWVAQNGRCPLSGRKLRKDKTSEIDHIRAFSKGGTSSPRNLRWVHRDVNQAKQALTDTEFLKLCKDVLENAT
jgi:hypothetical protein